jgi:hypothetical protein
MYPSWYIDLIYKLRRLQSHDLSLKELPLRLQAESRHLARTASERGHPGQQSFPEPPPITVGEFSIGNHIERNGKYRQAMREYVIASLPLPADPFPMPDAPLIMSQETALQLAQIVGVIARVYAEGAGIDITSAALHLTDRHGRELSPFNIPVIYGPLRDDEGSKETE